MCEPLNKVARQEAPGASTCRGGTAEKAWFYPDTRVVASAVSLVGCVSLSMLLRLSERCLIPDRAAGGGRPSPGLLSGSDGVVGGGVRALRSPSAVLHGLRGSLCPLAGLSLTAHEWGSLRGRCRVSPTFTGETTAVWRDRGRVGRGVQEVCRAGALLLG